MTKIDDYMSDAEEGQEKALEKSEEVQPKYNSVIIAQITHFFNNKPNTLQIEYEEPHVENNFPKSGRMKLRLKREDINAVFTLNTSEALELAEILRELSKKELNHMANLWSRK